MIESTTALTLNLQYPNVAVVAYAVQGDQAARKISAQLVDGSTAWTPPENALATIRYRKPDGTTGFYDADENDDPAIDVDGSTALITIANQALTVPGVVLMQLQFYTPDNQRVTTFAWSLVVQPSVLTDAEFVSEDYYNILTTQIAAVLDAAASLTGMTASATSLPAGSSPTVEVSGGYAANPYNLSFGIPAGKTGAPGPTGPGVPKGGAAGAVLRKASATDYDGEWVTVLPVSSGGTGATSAANARSALGAALPFINTGNVIATITGPGQSATPSKNCYCMVRMGTDSVGAAAYVTLDGVQIAITMLAASDAVSYPYATGFYVRAGQTVATRGDRPNQKYEMKFYSLYA